MILDKHNLFKNVSSIKSHKKSPGFRDFKIPITFIYQPIIIKNLQEG